MDGGACGKSIGGSEPRSCAAGTCGLVAALTVGGACGKSIGGSEPRSCAAGTCGFTVGTTGAALGI